MELLLRNTKMALTELRWHELLVLELTVVWMIWVVWIRVLERIGLELGSHLVRGEHIHWVHWTELYWLLAGHVHHWVHLIDRRILQWRVVLRGGIQA